MEPVEEKPVEPADDSPAAEHESKEPDEIERDPAFQAAVQAEVAKVQAETGKEISLNARKKLTKRIYGEFKKKAKKPTASPAAAAAAPKPASDELIRLTDPGPEAVECKCYQLHLFVGRRVCVSGWVHQLRQQGSKLAFVVLRDGTGYVQCVLNEDMLRSSDWPCVSREGLLRLRPPRLFFHTIASVRMYGVLKLEPRSLSGVELPVDFWQLVGTSAPDLETKANADSLPDQLLNNRHIVIRGMQSSSVCCLSLPVRLNANQVLRMRSRMLFELRKFFFERHFEEVSCPTIVQTQCEGLSNPLPVNWASFHLCNRWLDLVPFAVLR